MPRGRGRTLQELVAEGEFLQALLRESQREGLEIGRLMAIGGYSTVFWATFDGQDCVLKVPWFPPNDVNDHPQEVKEGYGPLSIELVSPTGPFCLRAAQSQEEAAKLLSEVGDHQRENPSSRLSKLLAVKELGGHQCLLYEPLSAQTLQWKTRYWPEEAKELIPQLAQALGELHATFGPHGDLKPEHVFLTESGPIFIDPLLSTDWIGSVGYALPLPFRDNKLRDLGGLAEMIAQMWSASLRWDGSLLYALVNRGNGRFGRGFDSKRTEEDMLLGTEAIDEPIRQWVRDVGLALWHRATRPTRELYDSAEKLNELIIMTPQVF